MIRLRGWLGRFALVGIVATALDLGLLWLFVSLGASVLAANVVAVSAAATFAYATNRFLTFRSDPFVRWVRQPTTFLAVALTAGGADMVMLAFGVAHDWPLVLAKLLALAVAGGLRLGAYRLLLFQGIRRRQGERVNGRPGPGGSLRLSLVIPAYQEESRIAATIDTLVAALEPVARAGGVEVVIVDDGSADLTTEVANAAAQRLVAEQRWATTVRVLRQPVNAGKGAAVRAGMMAAAGRTAVFTDADLAYSPDQVISVLEQVEDGWDMVVGSRHHRATTTLVRARRLREMGSRLINLFTLALLLGQYRDTQCGLKGFRSDVARLLFSQTLIDGFAFDVELFHLAERYELSLIEVPVTVENSERSTVNVVRDAFRLVTDLLRIRRWAKQGRYVDSPCVGWTGSESAVGS